MALSVSSLALWILWTVCIGMGAVAIVHLVVSMRPDNEEPDFSDIETRLRWFLRGGFDGEGILFRHERGGRFVRFEKIGDDGGSIALTFPEIRWGRDYLPRLQAYCDHHGLTFQASSEEGVRTAGCAQIDFGDDVKAASVLAKSIWTGFFGYGLGDRHTCSFLDYSTMAELTRHPPIAVSQEAQMERAKRHWSAHSDRIGMPWLGITGLGLLVAFFGLPIATLRSIGEPPDWQFAFGPIVAQGSAFSLAFFVLYILSLVGLRRFQRRLPINPHGATQIGRLALAASRPLQFAMLAAVVLVWMSR